MSSEGREPSLLVRVSGWVCAIPARHVIEIMRPLPVQPVQGAPPFVRGVSVIRGAPVPVVDLEILLGGGQGGDARRFAVLRAGPRRVALAVGEVLGLSRISAAADAPPPLLSAAVAEYVEKLGALDAHAFAVLDAARLLPEEAWSAA